MIIDIWMCCCLHLSHVHVAMDMCDMWASLPKNICLQVWPIYYSSLEINWSCFMVVCYNGFFSSKSHLIRVCIYHHFQAICVIGEFDWLVAKECLLSNIVCWYRWFVVLVFYYFVMVVLVSVSSIIVAFKNTHFYGFWNIFYLLVAQVSRWMLKLIYRAYLLIQWLPWFCSKLVECDHVVLKYLGWDCCMHGKKTGFERLLSMIGIIWWTISVTLATSTNWIMSFSF